MTKEQKAKEYLDRYKTLSIQWYEIEAEIKTVRSIRYDNVGSTPTESKDSYLIRKINQQDKIIEELKAIDNLVWSVDDMFCRILLYNIYILGSQKNLKEFANRFGCSIATVQRKHKIALGMLYQILEDKNLLDPN